MRVCEPNENNIYYFNFNLSKELSYSTGVCSTNRQAKMAILWKRYI